MDNELMWSGNYSFINLHNQNINSGNAFFHENTGLIVAYVVTMHLNQWWTKSPGIIEFILLNESPAEPGAVWYQPSDTPTAPFFP